MPVLNVPFRVQENEAACGIAAFEMVFRFNRRLSPLNTGKLFRRLVTNNLADPAKQHVLATHVLKAAQEKGFAADIGIFSSEPASMLSQLRHFVVDHEIPILAWQRLSRESPGDGHCRVIIGVEDEDVVLHDPISWQGRSTKWRFERLWEMWRPSGPNVVGGAGVWMTEGHLPDNGGTKKMPEGRWPADTEQAAFPGL